MTNFEQDLDYTFTRNVNFDEHTFENIVTLYLTPQPQLVFNFIIFRGSF